MLKLLLFSCLSFFLPDITSLPITTTLTTTLTTTPTTTLTTTLTTPPPIYTKTTPTTTTMYTITPIYIYPIIEDIPTTTTTTPYVKNYGINITNYIILSTLVFFGCFLIGLQVKYRVYFNQMLSPNTSPQPPPYYEDPSSISSSPIVKENSRSFMIKKTMPPPQYSDSDDIELYP